MLRMDDIQAGGLNDIREPGLADVGKTYHSLFHFLQLTDIPYFC